MSQRTVLQLGGLHWATSARAIESTLTGRHGVEAVEANAVNQTATVTYDPSVTSVAELAGWVRDCGYHCSGRSVPDHICEPMGEPSSDHSAHSGPDSLKATHQDGKTSTMPLGGAAMADSDESHAGHVLAADGEPRTHSSHEMMGHGGHAGMSIADMARDMRNRFLSTLR